MVATHGLAGILAAAHGKPEMASLCLQQARYQSPIAGLLKLAADADDGGLSLKLVLSCLANLSFIGFTQDMAEEEELARMLGGRDITEATRAAASDLLSAAARVSPR